MSNTIIKGAQRAKRKLADLLDEAKAVNLTPPDQHLSVDKKQQQFELKRRTIEEKIRRLKVYVGILGSINEKWLKYIQKQKNAQKRKEEDRYADMVDDNKGLLNLINDDQEAIISLEVYKDEFELVPQRLQQSKINIEPSQLKEPSQMFQQTVNLTQLPLLTFSGDQKLWREFCSSFDAAVHLQKIPDIQKLNYLILCLKENALQAVKGYDIAPENYDVIRKVLVKKIGNLSTIKKLLYNELYSIKGHDREWKTTVESMERILDNWKQWVSVWSIQASKLLSKRNGEVQRSQASSNGYQRKSIESKSSHNPRSARGETSALAAIKQPKPNDTLCSNHRKDTRSEKLREEKLESTMMNNTVAEQIRSEGKRILLLCKEISVTNPEIPKFQTRALALFDLSSQLSFISTNLAKRLHIRARETRD
uniref:TFIIS N-terminal domain-containing protein n=1 Tax=Loa loa TaxID=7209 RepID=A0A1I7VE83_LOALO